MHSHCEFLLPVKVLACANNKTLLQTAGSALSSTKLLLEMLSLFRQWSPSVLWPLL